MLYALRTKEDARMSSKRHDPIPLALALGALVAACGGREPVIVPPDPLQDVLLWTINAHGERATHWINGNRTGGRLVGSRPGIALALPSGVYEVGTRDVELPTCDCAAWEAAGQEGDCPAVEAGAVATTLFAVRRPGGEELAITDPPEASGDAGPSYSELESTASVIASMGPYLFVRVDTREMACGAAHESWSSEFSVFDLVAGRAVDLLTAEERAAVLGREQAAAFKLFEGDNLADAARPEDLELTMIAPVIVPGAGLGLRYQFTAGSSYAASDGEWGAYTRSVDVPAASLPAAVAPYAAIPPALNAFPYPGEGLAIGGFAPITATGDDLAALERLFTGAPEEADAEGSTHAVDP
jgi:hypothetical protein